MLFSKSIKVNSRSELSYNYDDFGARSGSWLCKDDHKVFLECNYFLYEAHLSMVAVKSYFLIRDKNFIKDR